MDLKSIFCAGSTQAARYARDILIQKGLPIVAEPGPEVGHLLLDVPSFSPSGSLRMGEM